MVTVEDIEKEVAGSLAIRIAMNSAVKKLKAAEKDLGKEIVRDLINGKRKLTPEEYKQAVSRLGLTAVNGIQMMENLNQAQKDYLFKRLDNE